MNQHRKNNDNPDRLQRFKNQHPGYSRNKNYHSSKGCQNAIGQRRYRKENSNDINQGSQQLSTRIKLMDKGVTGEILS